MKRQQQRRQRRNSLANADFRLSLFRREWNIASEELSQVASRGVRVSAGAYCAAGARGIRAEKEESARGSAGAR